MSIIGYNSFPLEGYANFEFLPISGNEKFSVTLDGESVKFIQSMDEMGSWHVVFNIDPLTQGTWEISGFDEGLPPNMPIIPMWIKQSGGWWSTDEIVDSELSSQSEWQIPTWTKTTVGWWYEEKISDNQFLNMIENLVKKKIIVI